MFSLNSSLQYYLYNGVTDMRNSFIGLSVLVKGRLDKDPLSGDVSIFINKRRNLVKLLRWEQGGFILYYKRLERGTIEIPEMGKDTISYEMNWSILVMMIEGISIRKIHKRRRFVTAGTYQHKTG